ncbi:MAG: NUDIX domain-containing protein [Acidobacteria bacterium]|nr:NUDIX domain-containing protein [Acidobacteriota bacterium]
MTVPQDAFYLIRAWFQAFNAADLEGLMALYAEGATSDSGSECAEGTDGIRRAFGTAIERSAQRTVRMIARVETGSIHAEWRGHERSLDGDGTSTSAGYDDFWIEDGLIVRQRSVLHALSFQAEEEAVSPGTVIRPSRQYPSQPIVGVGAVILRDGQVVLVKRRFEPLAGQWSLPGGRLELGEPLEVGLAREMLEETGLEVQVGPVVDVFDRILLDPERRVRYHYVLIDYLCRPIGGSLTHGSDVAAAECVDPGDLARFRLTPKATSVIEKALVAARHHQWEQAGR